MISISDILQGAQLIVQLATGRRRDVVIQQPGQPRPPMDIRVAATAFIWVCTTTILLIYMAGISVVLLAGSTSHDPIWAETLSDAVGGSVVIPILALAFAGVATGNIWKSAPPPQEAAPTPSPSALPAQPSAQEFEQRLRNLETIVTREATKPEQPPRDL